MAVGKNTQYVNLIQVAKKLQIIVPNVKAPISTLIFSPWFERSFNLQVFDGLFSDQLLLLVPLHGAHHAGPHNPNQGLLRDVTLLHLLPHISYYLGKAKQGPLTPTAHFILIRNALYWHKNVHKKIKTNLKKENNNYTNESLDCDNRQVHSLVNLNSSNRGKESKRASPHSRHLQLIWTRTVICTRAAWLTVWAG